MRLIRVVAVGFDGSSEASVAVQFAFGLARQLDASVVVVHTVGLLEHAAHNVDELGDVVRGLTEEAGTDPTRVRWFPTDGDPCTVLLRAGTDPVNADLLVVGSRGHGAHLGRVLGSTSHELAEQATIPLVIVPTELTAI